MFYVKGTDSLKGDTAIRHYETTCYNSQPNSQICNIPVVYVVIALFNNVAYFRLDDRQNRAADDAELGATGAIEQTRASAGAGDGDERFGLR